MKLPKIPGTSEGLGRKTIDLAGKGLGSIGSSLGGGAKMLSSGITSELPALGMVGGLLSKGTSGLLGGFKKKPTPDPAPAEQDDTVQLKILSMTEQTVSLLEKQLKLTEQVRKDGLRDGKNKSVPGLSGLAGKVKKDDDDQSNFSTGSLLDLIPGRRGKDKRSRTKRRRPGKLGRMFRAVPRIAGIATAGIGLTAGNSNSNSNGSKSTGALNKVSAGMKGLKLGSLVSGLAKFGKFLGPAALAASTAYSAFEGWNSAADTFKVDKATLGQKVSGAIGGIGEMLTFGLVDNDTIAKGVYEFSNWYGDKFTESLKTSKDLLVGAFTGAVDMIGTASSWVGDTFTGLFEETKKTVLSRQKRKRGMTATENSITEVKVAEVKPTNVLLKSNQTGSKISTPVGSAISNKSTLQTNLSSITNKLNDTKDGRDCGVASVTPATASVNNISAPSTTINNYYNGRKQRRNR